MYTIITLYGLKIIGNEVDVPSNGTYKKKILVIKSGSESGFNARMYYVYTS